MFEQDAWMSADERPAKAGLAELGSLGMVDNA